MPRKKAKPGSLLKLPLGRVFIREWRSFKDDMTQEVLTGHVMEMTGKSFTTGTLSRIENSKSPYQQWQLEAIAIALECSPADLISRDPTNPAPDELLLVRLSPKARQTAAEMIRALATQDAAKAA